MSKLRIAVEASSLPNLTKWHVQRVLRSIPEHDLEGLEVITVIDECPKMVTRMVSTRLHRVGLQNYWNQNYQVAASMLARAHSLDLENEDAGQTYRHAMEKLKIQSPSPLSAAEKEWLIKKYSDKPLTATRKPYFTGKR